MDEIQQRLRRRYLDRLGDRVKRLRKQYADRNWPELRGECHQLRGSGQTYGFPELSDAATRVLGAFPRESVARAQVSAEARQSIESLLSTIDDVLTSQSIITTQEVNS